MIAIVGASVASAKYRQFGAAFSGLMFLTMDGINQVPVVLHFLHDPLHASITELLGNSPENIRLLRLLAVRFHVESSLCSQG